jgi:hypothetical protein
MIDDLDSVTTEDEIEGDKLKGELDRISKTLNNEFGMPLYDSDLEQFSDYKEIEIYANYSNEESRSEKYGDTLTEYVVYGIYAKSDGKDIECAYRCTI